MMISVIDITMDHVDGFRASIDAIAREKRFLARTVAPSYSQMETFVRSNLDVGNPHVVALDGDIVVGGADIRRAGAPAMQHSGVLGMGVIAAYRGRGVGRRLLEAVIARAWQAGLQRIELEVRQDNAPAIALYERSGFQREGVKVRAMCMDGEYIDMVQMALLSPRR